LTAERPAGCDEKGIAVARRSPHQEPAEPRAVGQAVDRRIPFAQGGSRRPGTLPGAQFAASGQFQYSLTGQDRNLTIDPSRISLPSIGKGHCEYFATALALMLRSQDIPARIIVGYKCDEWNDVAAITKSASCTPTPGSRRTSVPTRSRPIQCTARTTGNGKERVTAPGCGSIRRRRGGTSKDRKLVDPARRYDGLARLGLVELRDGVGLPAPARYHL